MDLLERYALLRRNFSAHHVLGAFVSVKTLVSQGFRGSLIAGIIQLRDLCHFYGSLERTDVLFRSPGLFAARSRASNGVAGHASPEKTLR